MKNLSIEIINTMYGKRYAVVEDFKHFPASRDTKGNIVVKGTGKGQKVITEEAYTRHAIDFKQGENTYPAIFEFSKAGLAKAKEILALYKKKK